jgi:hypothetical protein
MKVFNGKKFSGSFSSAGTIFIFSCLIVFFALFSASTPAQTSDQCKTPPGERIYAAEKRLAELGYWIVRVDCRKDDSTRQALIAFQKAEGLKRTGVLNGKLAEALQNAKRPAAKYAGGRHVEIDISRQVLFLVDESGTVERILSVSTGNEKRYFEQGKRQTAHTPRGSFVIERKIAGVRRAPLGNLYNPNYFYGGVAIHGSNSVPVYPASHGCVRIPRFADKQFSRLVRVGMKVYVYD